MKTLTLAIAIFFSLPSFSQTQKMTIYCWANLYGGTEYGDLSKWLPDSTLKNITVNMKRHAYDVKDDLIYYMMMHGWKFVSPDPLLSGNFDGTGNFPTYMFSREIDVDDKALASLKAILAGMDNVKTPRKKH